MSSIRDQLLKAGLVTEEQVKQSEAKPKPNAKKYAKPGNKQNKSKQQAKKSKPPAKKKELSDLEQFYKQRETTEKAEQAEKDKAKKEAARIRKINRAKIGALIRDNMQNDEAADIRYNFVVGSSVKYLFVTEAQQDLLSAGKLAIAFLGEKRCLISPEVGEQIKAIEPSRIVILFEPEES
ncbi:DUF2058 family protein [Leucothrix sargassi]|nr:DUF2058 family protein [Leucothrix sargassi]